MKILYLTGAAAGIEIAARRAHFEPLDAVCSALPGWPPTGSHRTPVNDQSGGEARPQELIQVLR